MPLLNIRPAGRYRVHTKVVGTSRWCGAMAGGERRDEAASAAVLALTDVVGIGLTSLALPAEFWGVRRRVTARFGRRSANRCELQRSVDSARSTACLRGSSPSPAR